MCFATKWNSLWLYFKNKKIGQYNYRFVKNTGARDAITTKDIILIQRHILNISRFKDTLQNIAADVNNNFNITASDITELRRLILGIKESFTNVKPWYFYVQIGVLLQNLIDLFPKLNLKGSMCQIFH